MPRIVLGKDGRLDGRLTKFCVNVRRKRIYCCCRERTGIFVTDTIGAYLKRESLADP